MFLHPARHSLTGSAVLRVASRGERAAHNVLICAPASAKSNTIFAGLDAGTQAWLAERGSSYLKRISEVEIKETIVCMSGTGVGFPLSDILNLDVNVRADLLCYTPTVDGSVTMAQDGISCTIDWMKVSPTGDWSAFNNNIMALRESFSLESMPQLLYLDLVTMSTSRSQRRPLSLIHGSSSSGVPSPKRARGTGTPGQDSESGPLISRGEMAVDAPVVNAEAEQVVVAAAEQVVVAQLAAAQEVVAAPVVAQQAVEQVVVAAPGLAQRLIAAQNVANGYRSAYVFSQRTIGALRAEAEQGARDAAGLRAELAAAEAELEQMRAAQVAEPPTQAEAAKLLSDLADLEGPVFLPDIGPGGNVDDARDGDVHAFLAEFAK